MLNPIHFVDYVIRPTLKHLDMYSLAAENLLLGTALVESGLIHLVQLGGGPALGLYQQEKATHDDIWENYLTRRTEIGHKVMTLCSFRYGGDGSLYDWDQTLDANLLITNLSYATAMARIQYWRQPEPLPPHDDIEAQGRYYKQHYNTHLGKSTPEKYVKAWKRAMGTGAV